MTLHDVPHDMPADSGSNAPATEVLVIAKVLMLTPGRSGTGPGQKAPLACTPDPAPADPAPAKDAGQQRTAIHGPPATKPVITVDRLRKAYGPGVGVMDVSFSVNEGEIFGIIGPNGAGKTTTVECISGMRIPDSGVIDVLGLDPQADRAAIRESVGVQ